MSVIFKKTYTIPVRRKIAEGSFKPTSIERADIFINISDSLKTEILFSKNNIYKSIIYNINREPSKLIITSNSLNISMTDIVSPSKTPLYKKIVVLEEESYQIIEEIKKFTDEYLKVNTTIYLNTDLDYLFLNGSLIKIEPAFKIGNSMTVGDNVSIRKLKDRFKITLKTLNSQNFHVKLNSEFLFEPIVHKNWIEIPECIIFIKSKPLYIYNHSFNFITKTEILVKNNELFYPKDPILNSENILTEEFNDKYLKISYPTYRSNLMYNTESNSDLYIYLDTQFTDKTNPLFITDTLILEESSNILLLSITKKLTGKEPIVIKSPYTENKLYKTKGEDYSITFNNPFEKYSRPLDIKLGTQRVELDIEDIAREKANYVVINNGVILQYNNLNEIHKNIELVSINNSMNNNFEYNNEFYDNIQFEDKIRYYNYINNNNNYINT